LKKAANSFQLFVQDLNLWGYFLPQILSNSVSASCASSSVGAVYIAFKSLATSFLSFQATNFNELLI